MSATARLLVEEHHAALAEVPVQSIPSKPGRGSVVLVVLEFVVLVAVGFAAGRAALGAAHAAAPSPAVETRAR